MHCIDIGIGEEWYGIASGIISFRNNIVMALDSCPKCIFAQYLKNKSICINIYIYDLHLSNYILLFLIFQLSYGP